MKPKEIAKQAGVSVPTVSMVKNGRKFTDNWYLAWLISKETGKPATSYFHPTKRRAIRRYLASIGIADLARPVKVKHR